MELDESFTNDMYKTKLATKYQEIKEIVNVDIKEIEIVSLIRKGNLGDTFISKIEGDYLAVKKIQFITVE